MSTRRGTDYGRAKWLHDGSGEWLGDRVGRSDQWKDKVGSSLINSKMGNVTREIFANHESLKSDAINKGGKSINVLDGLEKMGEKAQDMEYKAL